MTSLNAVCLECLFCIFRHVFLLPDLLAFETMLDVELPQGGDSDALVSESAVEQLCSFLESEASPFFQRLVTEQKVNMFLIEKTRFLLQSESFGCLESFGAEVLHLVRSSRATVVMIKDHFHMRDRFFCRNGAGAAELEDPESEY